MVIKALQQQNNELIAHLEYAHQQHQTHLKLVKDKDEVIASKDDTIANKDETIQQLKQQYYELLQLFRQKKFGSSSEQQNPYQQSLFDEAEQLEQETIEADIETNSTQIKAHTRSKKGRVALPEHLPREEVIHDLPEAEKVCPVDGTALKHIGDDSSEQLDIVPAKIKVIKHVRKKYSCPCCQSYMATAAKPKQPIEKSIASAGLLAYILVAKYVDALPLYRQESILKRLGIELKRNTMALWMIKCSSLLQPVVNLIQERILESSVIHIDETRVQVLKEDDGNPQKKRYMWVQRASPPNTDSPYIFYHYASSRSADVVNELLAGYKGTIMSDAYAGYNHLQSQGITRLGCWAHARRKFIEAQRLQPQAKVGKADQVIAWIQKLYRIEKVVVALPTKQERFDYRQQHAKPIIDKVKQWKDKSSTQVTQQSALGKALHYLNGQWVYLARYLDDGDYPIDNNTAENAIRPFVIGRKNWLFSDTVAGAKASANLYSLIETVKAHNIEPYDYLKWLLERIPNASTADEVEKLMPDAYQYFKKIEQNDKGKIGEVN